MEKQSLNIRVCIRKRPLNKQEIENKQIDIIETTDN